MSCINGAQASNLMTVPTDCPQRDERLGWLGDASLSSDAMLLNWDAGPLLRAFADQIAEAEGADDGSLPDVVPHVRYGKRPGDASWTAALAQLCWALWRYAGDLAPARAHLGALVANVANLEQQTAAGLADVASTYGDWCPPPQRAGDADSRVMSGKPFAGAWSFVATVDQVAQLADALGNASTAAQLASLRDDACRGVEQRP